MHTKINKEMTTFTLALVLLVLGYLLYGAVVDRVFGSDRERQTPAYAMRDDVDYMPMPTWRVFLVQFLNIAGTGPIFGAILGVLYGPAAYIWIVLGCIFGGAVHDYMCGMISLRCGGASLPEIIGNELGVVVRHLMRILSLVLLVLVGTVFAQTPASIMTLMTGGWPVLNTVMAWTLLIFAYYVLATLLPIDKLIGRVYPLFGLALLVMAAGVMWGIYSKAGFLPELGDAFQDHHPSAGSVPIFPGLCITIACGAVSGFHGTQSPMMSRCLTNERWGRPVFYGAMITEGVVALIWAAAAVKFASSLDVSGDTPYAKLLSAMTNPETGKVNPAILVYNVCHSWLGTVGAVLAILGVVAAPLTSGDTALRSARLIFADILHLPQTKILYRLALCLPVFAVSLALMFVDFQVIWRYFAWTNQTLAMFTLWASTVWLHRQQRCYWVALVPALFMTVVSVCYIVVAPEGLHMPMSVGVPAALVVAAVSATQFAVYVMKSKKK